MAEEEQQFRRQRTTLRAKLTKTGNEIEAELAKEDRCPHILREKLEKLVTTFNKVEECDTHIQQALLQANCEDQKYEDECNKIEEYEDLVSELKIRVSDIINPPEPPRSYEGQHHNSTSAPESVRSYKLPKIELKKFDGQIENWLSFWSQFKRIHEDPKLHVADKFQYLIQSTIEGSRARLFVESLPLAEENYESVVKALKDNCGSDKILQEFYVKEMNKMQMSAERGMPLETVVMKFVSNLRALESLGLKREQDSVYLYQIFESLLPKDIIIAWERSPMSGYGDNSSVPSGDRLEALVKFAQTEVRREQRLSIAQERFTPSSVVKEKKFEHRTMNVKSPRKHQESDEEDIPTAAALHIGTQRTCTFCDKSHQPQNCPKSFDMSLEEKNNAIRRKKCCFACLRPGHRASDCNTFVRCTGCSRKHYHIMCPTADTNKKKDNMPEPEVKSVNINHTNIGRRLVLLHTLRVKAVTGSKKVLRMMIDNGSQRSYIRKAVVNFLKCKPVSSFVEKNVCFGGVTSRVERRIEYRVALQNLSGSFERELVLAATEKITGQIPTVPKGPWIEELSMNNIELSDYDTHEDEIDILIGMDLMKNVITGKSLMLGCGLTANETLFGWTLGGEVPGTQKDTAVMTITSALLTESSCSQLWDLETLGIQDPAEVMSKKEREEEVKNHFLQTVSRKEDGRYCVSLPWIGEVKEIPNNRSVAEKRLNSATLKLKKDEKTEDYGRIFESWSTEGFIEEVVEESQEKACHYLPHRAVYKPESKTTPVRPVFDASCKVGRNPSLNECLEKGPNFIELIPNIMHRFREGKIGVISDIRKAFQVIEVADKDKDYLRFLWWEDSSCKKIKVMKHNRVVFGVNCSPFLLGAVLEYHLNGVEEKDKIVADKLKNSMYVDNCVTSVETMEEYSTFKSDATRILADAKMDLREWECGPLEVSGVDHSISEGCGLEVGSDCTSYDTYVLGMKWNKVADSLRCDTVPNVPTGFTKRTLLSIMQQIFDPMGFLSPAMILPKLALQEAWAEKVNWDDDLPEHATLTIKKWTEELKQLEEIRIPRSMDRYNLEREKVQMHIFCDASQHAYAAVIFLRVVRDQEVSVYLVQSKARVAPLKKSTIPRLELLGCTIAARLYDSVKVGLKFDGPRYFWSDSSTALAWIKGNDEWGTFVGNRVREICRLTSVEDWRHVPGIHNPADLPSRGCTPNELLVSRWWEGPTWLRKPEEEWPTEEIRVDEEMVLAEKKKRALNTVVATASDASGDPWYAKRSSFFTCVCVLAYVKRFVARTRKQFYYSSKELTPEEYEMAERHILRLIQADAFPAGGEVICGLNVEMKESLLCVVTKLTNRTDTPGFRYPVLLPHSHVLVDRLIHEVHVTNGHAGVQFLMSKLREKYWIVKTRKAIRTVVQRCVICRRHTTKAPEVPVAPLPENRVKNAKVFEVTGVDLAGPLYLKDKSKVWIVLFTCAIYRGIHLELVTSLSTDAFLLALIRFIKRRGRPAIIYSDNGTNFVGADNLFRNLNWGTIVTETRIERIEWKFNPPSAAWWGGWWERLVRTVKDLLKRMLGHGKLSYVQLETCLCEVESVVNSRPLTYVSEDQDDLIPLSPVMFMQDLRETGCPEMEVLKGDDLRKRYKDLSTLKEELCHRFRSEYLGQLVHKGKANKVRKFEVGEVVLVASDNKKRLQWPMAKILELIPGKDGNIRLARVKTSCGEIIRPLQRLIPLEVRSKAPEINLTAEMKTTVKEAQKKRTEKAVDIVEDEAEVTTRAGRKIKKPVGFVPDSE